MAPLPAGMPGFHPGAPRLPQQSLYYGQGTPGLMPPQLAGYGFQQQLVPGIRPGVPPNFVMPPYQFQRQGPSGQRMGQRRNGNTQQMQQQVASWFCFIFLICKSVEIFSYYLCRL